MSGTLYVVATPIGNLGDLTRRAEEILRAAPAIAAEDTRRARVLLDHLGIATRVLSLPAFDERGRADALLDPVEQGSDLALVTDAGTPAISDPGSALVARAVARGIQVVPIPGACAAVAAVSASGLSADRFCFLGFLPRKGQGREELLETMGPLSMAMVIYESPHRLAETLRDLRAAWGDRRALVARELTKLYEELARGSLSELAERFSGEVRGEVVVVVEGAPREERAAVDWAAVEAELRRRLAGSSQPLKDLAREVAEAFGCSRKEAYTLALKVAGRR